MVLGAPGGAEGGAARGGVGFGEAVGFLAEGGGERFPIAVGYWVDPPISYQIGGGVAADGADDAHSRPEPSENPVPASEFALERLAIHIDAHMGAQHRVEKFGVGDPAEQVEPVGDGARGDSFAEACIDNFDVALDGAASGDEV